MISNVETHVKFYSFSSCSLETRPIWHALLFTFCFSVAFEKKYDIIYRAFSGDDKIEGDEKLVSFQKNGLLKNVKLACGELKFIINLAK